MSPKLPLELKSSKPKCLGYPTEILTVGDEFRTVRLDRGLTQNEVGEMLGVNRNFIYELELNQHQLTIYSLHKATKFLGYIPTVLNIDSGEIGDRLYSHRILNGYSLKYVANQIGLDKSTLGRVEKGSKMKPVSKEMIINYLSII